MEDFEEAYIVVRDKFVCAYIRFLFSEFEENELTIRAVLLSCHSVLRRVLRDAFNIAPEKLIDIENQARKAFLDASDLDVNGKGFVREAGYSTVIHDCEEKVYALLMERGVIRREERS